MLTKSKEEIEYSSNPADHIGFATSYVKLFIPLTHYAFEDIKGEAILGLVEAAKNYDPTVSKFVTYAKSYILRGIYRGLRSLISFSGQNSRNHRKFYGKRPKIPMNATREEISTILDIPQNELDQIINACAPLISLDDQLISDHRKSERHEIIQSLGSDPYTVLTEGIDESVRYKIRVKDAMKKANIKDRNRDIIEKRLGLNGEEGVTLEKLGEMYHLSRERIRQIQENTIQIIKQYL